MKKSLLILCLTLGTIATNAVPTITIDGDKSDWAEVPMLTEPGTWPMLKVLPAADATLGTNALVYMMENTVAFDPTWAQYPTEFIDKDYDKSTAAIAEYWAFKAMGVDYNATTGVNPGTGWISFPKAMSADNKVFEIGFPATYITDLGSKFGFAMYYNDGAWFCPDRSEPAKNSFDPANGFLYKARSYTTVAGTTNLTTANVYAHPSMGEVGEYVDFGLRDNGYDTLRWAAFPINLTKPAVYDVTTNATPGTSSYKFEFWLVDVASNAIVAHIPAPESSISSSKTTYTFGSLDLRNVPAGKYMLKVMNKKAFSKVKLNSIDLTYAGGNTVDIPGTLGIADAVITGGKRQDGVIKFDDATTGTAEWRVTLDADTYVDISTTIKNAYGHNITIAVYEEDGVTPVENVSEGKNEYSKDAEGHTINLGGMYLEAGNYVVKYSNATAGSDAKVVNVAFTYVGGDVQDMPGTTAIADAWFSSNGTRADGKISFPESTLGWAKWNINVASAGTYNVTVNIQNEYGHNYSVEFLKEGESTPISIDEGGTKYGHDATLYPVELGSIALEAGNYEMKVSNAIGDAALLSVTLAYAGGAAIDLAKDTPAELLANADAILSEDWTIEDSKITHAESKALTGWAKWNVDCADEGNYNVTVNIASDNGHLVRVEVFEDEAASAIYTLDEAEATKYKTGDLAIDLGNITLDNKEYVFKVSNTVSSSHVQIASIDITYVNGARATLPATFDFADGMLSTKAHITADELWFNTIGDSNPVGQWAKWNVKVATAGTFLFTMNVSSTNGQTYKISILNGETEMDAFESGSLGSGDKTVKHYFNLAAGNYTVKLENTYSWSQGHIVSLVVTEPSLVTIDETATDNSVLVANYYEGEKDIKITRTIIADMYNTICLPFDVSSAQLQAIFGSDVELIQMSSAELADDVLTLNFDNATSIYRGTPYLIKTSSNVVNPVFTNVEIKAKVAASTSGTNADFVGSFIKGTIPASEDNLFLGANDKLYFPTGATEIKGMRAYFQIHDAPAGVIRRARIVQQGNVVTELELVNGEWMDARTNANGVLKAIENGQLIIIRDGIRYNAMGQVVK